jgi:glycosyltransferase involved in cell wall biosynthesis
MATVTFVTTCRGRLAHLRETLPSLVSQPDTTVVVVDYSCPDKSGDWVEAHFPQVEIVRSADRPVFEVSRARNLGAAIARSPWLCFIDADTRVSGDFCEQIKPLLTDGHYYRARPRTIEMWGTLICGTEDFKRVGGYDEVIQGWGKEDEDLYARLSLAGLRDASFPGSVLQTLSHADGERVAHYDMKDRWLNESINHVYCRAKIDLILLQQKELELNVRRRLYDKVRAAVIEARDSGKPMMIALPLMTQQTRACGPLETRLVYSLPEPHGSGRLEPKTGRLLGRRLRGSREEP